MTSKESAAVEILQKHIPNGCINLKSYAEEKAKILTAMEEYGASLQPKEADKDREDVEDIAREIGRRNFNNVTYNSWNNLGIQATKAVMSAIQEAYNLGKSHRDKDIQSKWISVLQEMAVFIDLVQTSEDGYEAIISNGKAKVATIWGRDIREAENSAVSWCTGFNEALRMLREDQNVQVSDTTGDDQRKEPR